MNLGIGIILGALSLLASLPRTVLARPPCKACCSLSSCSVPHHQIAASMHVHDIIVCAMHKGTLTCDRLVMRDDWRGCMQVPASS